MGHNSLAKRRRNDHNLEFTGIEDLRHESLNQILKQNMEMNIDIHFDDDDDTNNDGDVNLSDDPTLYNGLGSRDGDTSIGDGIGDGSCCSGDTNNNHNVINNSREKHLMRQLNHNQVASTAAHDKNLDSISFNQLIDDERSSMNDDNDDVSVSFSIVWYVIVQFKP